ncbi:MAG: hypothetical protein GY828_04635 [Candidatus Gracilibacteria bacterium]|nr:hypothetical protein [Candidatus Gracilibacteria bacterium]
MVNLAKSTDQSTNLESREYNDLVEREQDISQAEIDLLVPKEDLLGAMRDIFDDDFFDYTEKITAGPTHYEGKLKDDFDASKYVSNDPDLHKAIKKLNEEHSGMVTHII